jgi:hypothetical protein
VNLEMVYHEEKKAPMAKTPERVKAVV